MINGRSMQISLAVNLLVIKEMFFFLLSLSVEVSSHEKKHNKIKESAHDKRRSRSRCFTEESKQKKQKRQLRMHFFH